MNKESEHRGRIQAGEKKPWTVGPCTGDRTLRGIAVRDGRPWPAFGPAGFLPFSWVCGRLARPGAWVGKTPGHTGEAIEAWMGLDHRSGHTRPSAQYGLFVGRCPPCERLNSGAEPSMWEGVAQGEADRDPPGRNDDQGPSMLLFPVARNQRPCGPAGRRVRVGL